jgi:hypothetical protein
VGAFVGWIFSMVDDPDEPLGAVPVLLVLGAATRSYYDWAQLTAPQGRRDTLTFARDGGKYEVDLAWKVFPQ